MAARRGQGRGDNEYGSRNVPNSDVDDYFRDDRDASDIDYDDNRARGDHPGRGRLNTGEFGGQGQGATG